MYQKEKCASKIPGTEFSEAFNIAGMIERKGDLSSALLFFKHAGNPGTNSEEMTKMTDKGQYQLLEACNEEIDREKGIMPYGIE